MAYVDENAYGLHFTWLGVEDEDYGLEASAFLERHRAFHELVLGEAPQLASAEALRIVTLGHSVYLEFADGDELGDPFRFLKDLRGRLKDQDYNVGAVMTYGGRWVAEEGADNGTTLPSEPLRRALLAEAAMVGSEEEEDGWGAGLYVDVEAIEAMGKALKNAPTALEIGGAHFYRFGA